MSKRDSLLMHRPKSGGMMVTGDYPPETPDRILDFVGLGYDIDKIARQQGMPPALTIRMWLRNNVDFAEMWDRALANRARVEMAKVYSLADNATKDDVAVAKLQIDTRFKMAEKLLKNVYGSTKQIEHTAARSLADVVEMSRDEQDSPHLLPSQIAEEDA